MRGADIGLMGISVGLLVHILPYAPRALHGWRWSATVRCFAVRDRSHGIIRDGSTSFLCPIALRQAALCLSLTHTLSHTHLHMLTAHTHARTHEHLCEIALRNACTRPPFATASRDCCTWRLSRPHTC